MGDAEVFAPGLKEVVLDGVGGRESDGVDEDVDGCVGLGDAGEDGVNLFDGGDVALKGLGARQLRGEGIGVLLEALGLVADGERRASCGKLLADGPGDAAFIGQAEDDGDFALEIDHACVWLLVLRRSG